MGIGMPRHDYRGTPHEEARSSNGRNACSFEHRVRDVRWQAKGPAAGRH
jgi:hypothetical protein